jgi:hypothetical protein
VTSGTEPAGAPSEVAALRLELPHAVLAAEERTAEVDRRQSLEVLDRVVLERLAGLQAGDARVVEHHVELAVGHRIAPDTFSATISSQL